MNIEGVLLINLDPPYLGFATDKGTLWKHSSKDELLQFLVAVDAAEAGIRLPRECQVRLPGRYSKDKLREYGLL